MDLSTIQSALEKTVLLTSEQKQEALILLKNIPEAQYPQILEALQEGEGKLVEFGKKKFQLQKQEQKAQQEQCHQEEIIQADEDLENDLKNI